MQAVPWSRIQLRQKESMPNTVRQKAYLTDLLDQRIRKYDEQSSSYELNSGIDGAWLVRLHV